MVEFHQIAAALYLASGVGAVLGVILGRERIERGAALGLALGAFVFAALAGSEVRGAEGFRAGAYAADITPRKFPISMNGQMVDQRAMSAFDKLHARCLVLDDGEVLAEVGQFLGASIMGCVVAPEDAGVVKDKRRGTYSGLREAGGLAGANEVEYALVLAQVSHAGTTGEDEEIIVVVEAVVEGSLSLQGHAAFARDLEGIGP